MLLQKLGEGSTWVCNSLINTAEPCECPMKMIDPPSLSWARSSFQAESKLR